MEQLTFETNEQFRLRRDAWLGLGLVIEALSDIALESGDPELATRVGKRLLVLLEVSVKSLADG